MQFVAFAARLDGRAHGQHEIHCAIGIHIGKRGLPHAGRQSVGLVKCEVGVEIAVGMWDMKQQIEQCSSMDSEARRVGAIWLRYDE